MADNGPQFTGVGKGYRSTVRTKVTVRGGLTRGGTITQEFESAGNNLGGVLNDAKKIGADYELTPSNARSRLIMTSTGDVDGYGDQTTTIWQIYTNEIQKDIRLCPRAHALGVANLSRVGADFRRIQKGGPGVYAKTVADTFYIGTPDARLLLDLMVQGVTSFYENNYVARRTVNIPYLFSGSIQAGFPDSAISNFIDSIPITGPNDGTNFLWGWRQMGASRTFAANNRTEITGEWWLGSYSLLLYDRNSINTRPG